MRHYGMRLTLLGLFALLPALAAAQTPTATVAWFYRNEIAATVNTTYTQVVKVDATTITTATVKPTCVQAGADVSCSIPVGTLASGAHTLSVSATQNNVEAITTINNLNLGSAPKNATDFKYQVNITVNIP